VYNNLSFNNFLKEKIKMAQNHTQKQVRNSSQEVNKIFDDLELYLQFCRDYGYVYDESHLYDTRTPFGEFVKMTKGREPWDQWRTQRRFKPDYHNKAAA
jgi:hypothetical protein